MSDLPHGWEWTSIGEVTATSLGKMLDKKQATGMHKTPYLRNINVRWGSFDLSDLAEMDIHPDELDRVLARPGDVIACEGGEPGRAAVWTGPGTIALQKALHRIQPTEAIRPAYLALLLRHLAMSQQLERFFTGTTIRHLPQEKLRLVGVPLPPWAEQGRIVAAIEELLSRLDAAEGALRSARRRLATFGSATTSEALRGEWPVVRLGDHAVDQRYGTSAKAGRDGDVPVLRMGNIVDGRVDFADLKYLPDGHPDLEACTLGAGDLLFNRTNSPELVGKSAVFEGALNPVTFASYLIRVRLDEKLDPHWVATTINSLAGRRYIDSVRTQQVGQANVNGTKLRNFPIPMPSIDVQRERLTQLDLARTWFRAVESQIQLALTRASALRRSILAAAFSGKLVPQSPDDEPASVLLGRIRDERVAITPTPRSRRQAASR